MSDTLWKLPVPSSALWEGASFQELAGRACALICMYESSEGVRVIFEGVEAYKCTYHNACTLEMIETAYDELIDVGNTEWLGTVSRRLDKYGNGSRGLYHLMIYFDDGPCYEFICRSFRTEQITDEGEHGRT